MALGDLALNRIPSMPAWGIGWIALFTVAFSVWNTIFYIRTGAFIYPFLDAHRPYAWVAYLGLYFIHWVAYVAFLGLMKGRDALVRRHNKVPARRTRKQQQ